MFGALIHLFVTAFVFAVKLCIVVPAKLLGLAAGLGGHLLGWGVWLALIPLKIVLLPFKLLC